MSVRASAAVVLVILTASPAHADPAFPGTVWITPDMITSADPSAFTGATYTGAGAQAEGVTGMTAFESALR